MRRIIIVKNINVYGVLVRNFCSPLCTKPEINHLHNTPTDLGDAGYSNVSIFSFPIFTGVHPMTLNSNTPFTHSSLLSGLWLQLRFLMNPIEPINIIRSIVTFPRFVP